MERLIVFLMKEHILKKDGVIMCTSDGAPSQYSCATAYYFLSVLAYKYKITIDRFISAPGHRRGIADGINGVTKRELTIASGRELMSAAQAHQVDKILESLAAGTKTVSPLLASTLKTTAQYDSCNQASHSQSQINHLIRQIANPIDKTGVIGITTRLSES